MGFVKDIIGTITGSKDASDAAEHAADTQGRAAELATAEARRQYDLTRSDTLAQLERQRTDQQPWLDAGKNALAQLLQGVGPDGQYLKPFSMADYQADPGYQFRLDQGNKALTNSAAARGNLLSGAALKAAARYNQGEASQEYGNAFQRYQTQQGNGFNRLASLAGVGQTTAQNLGQQGQNAYNTLANAGQNTSNNVQNNITGAANARASSYITKGNQWGNDVNMIAKIAGNFFGG